MANLEERISLVNALVNRFEPEAIALGRAEGWRQVTLESLLSLPLAALRSLESTRSVDALSSRIATAKVQLKTLGQTTQDLTYKPITPCRFIDTRNVGGKISGTRGYDLATNGGTYGGSATCDPTVLFGVNENAFGGIAMNVTIVDPSGAPGFAAVKPTAAAPVVSLINWYQSGPSVQTANQAIVTMDQGSSGSEFVVQTSSAVHVIVDFFGAFIAPEATALQCLQPSSLENSYTIGTGISNFLYSKSCPTGYTIVSGACYADTNPVYILANGTSSNQLEWFCRVNNLTSANATLNVWARCCRVPGR